MHLKVSMQILENEKLTQRLMEHSYFIKYLNRNPLELKNFQKELKVLYKERPTDKLSSAIDNIEMISSIIDTIK